MKHELASEKLLELAYGELPPREARAVEAHASACEACRRELARIRETRALMAQLPVEPPPERGQGIVLAAAREAAATRGRKARSILPPWLWAGSAGAVAAVAVAIVSWQLGKAPPPQSLRAQDSALMGSPAPAVAAAPPASAPAAVEPPKGLEGAAPEKRKAAPALAKGEAGAGSADGYAGALGRGAGAGSIGVGDARRDRERDSGERGGGLGLVAPAEPSAPAGGASAAAPKATWAPPSAPEPQAAPSPAPPSRREAAGVAAASSGPENSPGRLAEAERCERMPAMPEPAPAPQSSRAPLGEKKRAAAKPAAATPAAAPPDALRDSGATETRSFEACPGERRRIVERDGDGGVIRYVREGERRTIEHRFSPDGRLVSAVEISGGVRRALALDAPGLVRLARDAGMDAPPRCESP